jgi:hypothetical protein
VDTVDATVDSADPEVIIDAGSFDVDIQYADRDLPEVSVPPEGGAETGTGLPNCPPWFALDDQGNILSDPVDPSLARYAPTDYTSGGGIGPAIDGGVCATYPWYPVREPAFANYWAMQAAGNASVDFNPFPPCNWAIEAGVAQSGTQSGVSRYLLCTQAYSCIADSECWRDPRLINACVCGLGDAGTACELSKVNPVGPCKDQELAAFEIPSDDPTPVNTMFQSFYNSSTSADYPFINISLLNYVFEIARTQKFLVYDAGP